MQFSEAAQWADIAFLLAGFAAQRRRSRVLEGEIAALRSAFCYHIGKLESERRRA